MAGGLFRAVRRSRAGRADPAGCARECRLHRDDDEAAKEYSPPRVGASLTHPHLGPHIGLCVVPGQGGHRNRPEVSGSRPNTHQPTTAALARVTGGVTGSGQVRMAGNGHVRRSTGSKT
jgi:hypothetical protein